MYTLDTNVLIYIAANEPKVTSFVLSLFKQNVVFILPSIVIVEYLAYPQISLRDKQNFLERTQELSIIDLHEELAIQAGELRSSYKIKLADAVIAATALETRSTLLTRNYKDFQKISSLKIQKI